MNPSKAWVACWLVCVFVLFQAQVGDATRTNILRYVPPTGSKSGRWKGVSHSSDMKQHIHSAVKDETTNERIARYMRTLGIGTRSMIDSLLQGQLSIDVIYALVSMCLSSLGLKSDPMLGYDRSASAPYDYQGADIDPSWDDLGAGTWVNSEGEGLEVVEDMDLDDDDTRLSYNVSMASTLSALAYFDLNTIDTHGRFGDVLKLQATGFPAFIEGDSEYDQQVFVYLFPETRTMWLAFRGTQSIVDMHHDLDYRLIPVDKDHTDLIEAHSGFVHKWASVRSGVIDFMKFHSENFDYIITTGHSLGGAIATLAAPFIAEQFPDKPVECISFGSPRIGNEYFVAWYTHLIDISTRIVNEKDPIVHMPIEPEFHHIHEAYTISSTGKLWKLADTPAAMRFLHAISEIDFDSVLGSHDRQEYIDRVAAANTKIDQRLKRRNSPPIMV